MVKIISQYNRNDQKIDNHLIIIELITYNIYTLINTNSSSGILV